MYVYIYPVTYIGTSYWLDNPGSSCMNPVFDVQECRDAIPIIQNEFPNAVSFITDISGVLNDTSEKPSGCFFDWKNNSIYWNQEEELYHDFMLNYKYRQLCKWNGKLQYFLKFNLWRYLQIYFF